MLNSCALDRGSGCILQFQSFQRSGARGSGQAATMLTLCSNAFRRRISMARRKNGRADARAAHHITPPQVTPLSEPAHTRTHIHTHTQCHCAMCAQGPSCCQPRASTSARFGRVSAPSMRFVQGSFLLPTPDEKSARSTLRDRTRFSLFNASE